MASKATVQSVDRIADLVNGWLRDHIKWIINWSRNRLLNTEIDQADRRLFFRVAERWQWA